MIPVRIFYGSAGRVYHCAVLAHRVLDVPGARIHLKTPPRGVLGIENCSQRCPAISLGIRDEMMLRPIRFGHRVSMGEGRHAARTSDDRVFMMEAVAQWACQPPAHVICKSLGDMVGAESVAITICPEIPSLVVVNVLVTNRQTSAFHRP